MRQKDRVKAMNGSIATSIFKLLEETGKFSDQELQALNPEIDRAVAEGRTHFLTEELPILTGKKSARNLRIG